MSDSDDFTIIRMHPRPTSVIELPVPTDTLDLLHEMAGDRDMSLEGLLRFYIGNGLRQDLARRFAERPMEAIERVLARHISSEDERSAILREIRGEQAA
jgi:hypothetical protein